MGDAAEVRAKISQSLPGIDWRDPAKGHLRTANLSVEIQHQRSGDTDDFMLRARGNGDPMPLVLKLMADHNWIAIDGQTAENIDLVNPSTNSWHEFKTYQETMVPEHFAAPPGNWINEHPAIFGWSFCLILVLVIRWMMRDKPL